MWDDVAGCCAYALFESLFWGPWSWVVYGLLLIAIGGWFLFIPDTQPFGWILIGGGVLILAIGGGVTGRRRRDL